MPFLLGKVGNLANKLMTKALEPFGIKPRHVAALTYVQSHDGPTQQQLVSALWSDSSSVVSVVDDLERLGFAERTRAPEDRRSYNVRITQAGEELLRLAQVHTKETEEIILGSLSDEDRETLLRIFQQIVGVQDAPTRRRSEAD